MEISALKLGYDTCPTEHIRNAAEGMAEIAKIRIDFDTCLSPLDNELVSTDEVFDGRLCAAAIVVFAMMASKCSADSELKVIVERGMGAVRLRLSFKKRFGGWQYPLEYIKNMAYANHTMLFDVIDDLYTVGVSFVPFYQDVGFVGVKGGEELFDFVHQMELR
jgi:hypothetical protein